ncbi:hypothetical protein JTB14_035942 [Gonioctena quinquepunctata]|nr:hypothetical protein JTB14_035942 [Gonioctena quinquepunctata]
MVSCALRSCSSRNNVDKKESTGISFHRFPKDPAINAIWVEFVNRDVWKPKKYSVLCSKHFSEPNFDRSSKCYERLNKNAVPTLQPIQDRVQKGFSKQSEEVNILSNIILVPRTMDCDNEVPSTSTFVEETMDAVKNSNLE